MNPIPFEAQNPGPLEVRVTDTDGKQWLLIVSVAVGQVRSTGVVNADGSPKFEVDFLFGMKTERRAGTAPDAA